MAQAQDQDQDQDYDPRESGSEVEEGEYFSQTDTEDFEPPAAATIAPTQRTRKRKAAAAEIESENDATHTIEELVVIRRVKAEAAMAKARENQATDSMLAAHKCVNHYGCLLLPYQVKKCAHYNSLKNSKRHLIWDSLFRQTFGRNFLLTDSMLVRARETGFVTCEYGINSSSSQWKKKQQFLCVNPNHVGTSQTDPDTLVTTDHHDVLLKLVNIAEESLTKDFGGRVRVLGSGASLADRVAYLKEHAQVGLFFNASEIKQIEDGVITRNRDGSGTPKVVVKSTRGRGRPRLNPVEQEPEVTAKALPTVTFLTPSRTRTAAPLPTTTTTTTTTTSNPSPLRLHASLSQPSMGSVFPSGFAASLSAPTHNHTHTNHPHTNTHQTFEPFRLAFSEAHVEVPAIPVQQPWDIALRTAPAMHYFKSLQNSGMFGDAFHQPPHYHQQQQQQQQQHSSHTTTSANRQLLRQAMAPATTTAEFSRLSDPFLGLGASFTSAASPAAAAAAAVVEEDETSLDMTEETAEAINTILFGNSDWDTVHAQLGALNAPTTTTVTLPPSQQQFEAPMFPPLPQPQRH